MKGWIRPALTALRLLYALFWLATLIGINYFIAGALCLVEGTAPLGLAIIAPALLIAALFNAFLARGGGVDGNRRHARGVRVGLHSRLRPALVVPD